VLVNEQHIDLVHDDRKIKVVSGLSIEVEVKALASSNINVGGRPSGENEPILVNQIDNAEGDFKDMELFTDGKVGFLNKDIQI
jgi:hypothetical protein